MLTGSQLFRLGRNAGESLAGRAGLLTLHGLTRAEREGYEEEVFCPGRKRTTPAKGTETMAGAMLETAVVSEVVKELSNRGLDARSRLAYYRDHSGREVDVVVMEGGRLHPVEVKRAATPGREAVRHFKALAEAAGEGNVGEGAVVCLAEKGYALDGKNRVVPLGEA